MHSVVFHVLIYFVVSASCGVLEKQVTKYEMETVQLSCHTEIDRPAEWGIRSAFQNYAQGTPERHDGYRRIYSSAGFLRVFRETERYSISTGNGFYNLTIQNLHISESGEYVCWEDLGSGPESSTQVSVYVNISLLQTNETSSVFAGSDITLPCRRNVDVRWMYVKSEHSSQDVISNDKSIVRKYKNYATVTQTTRDYNLSLHNVQLNQSGLYICVEDGMTLFKHPIYLTVLVNTSTLQSSLALIVYDGDSITLPCRASLRRPSIRWHYSKSRETPQNVIFDRNNVDSKYTSKVTASFNETNQDYNLTLHNVQLNEYGWYICIEDGDSTTLHSISVAVRVNISRFLTHQKVSVDVGDNVTLPCPTKFDGLLRWLYISSQSAPQIVIANGNVVESKFTGKVTLHVDQTTRDYNLSLYGIQLSEMGWYVCIEDCDIVSLQPVFLTVREILVDGKCPNLSMGASIGLSVGLAAAVALVTVAAILLKRGMKYQLKGGYKQRYELERLMKTKSKHVIPGHVTVRGVTSMKEELFVSRDQSVEEEELLIEVYSAETFELKRNLSVNWIRKVDLWSNGLTASEKNNCIYIFDLREDFVYKVNLNEVDEQVKWRVDNEPIGLSVNKEGNVIVTCLDNTIEEYTPSGSLVREVKLQSEVSRLLHSVELSNGHYAVCHQRPVNGVSVVDREGRVVFTYRNDPQSNTLLLSDPCSIAVTADDCILVADREHNRISILDSSLSWSRDIYDVCVASPACIHFDESRDRLFVGDYYGRVVKLIIK